MRRVFPSHPYGPSCVLVFSCGSVQKMVAAVVVKVAVRRMTIMICDGAVTNDGGGGDDDDDKQEEKQKYNPRAYQEKRESKNRQC